MLCNPPWVDLFPKNATRALQAMADEMVESPNKDKAPSSPIKTHAADSYASLHDGRNVIHSPGHRERKLETKGMARVAAKEAAAKALKREARRIFDSFDVDGNSQIDEQELMEVLKALLQSLGKEEPPPMMLQREAAKALATFDTDGDGLISFDEFMVMITARPWKNLLPVEIQGLISDWPSSSPPRSPSPRRRMIYADAPSVAIAEANRSSSHGALGNPVSGSSLKCGHHAAFKADQKQSNMSNAAEVAGAAFHSNAKRLFNRTDRDGNGMVDHDELVLCLEELHASHGQVSRGYAYHQEAQTAIAQFGVQGMLDFEGFCRLIGTPAFVSILPKELQAAAQAQAHGHAKKEHSKNIAKAAAGMAVMKAARKIFDAADGDKNGSIDPDELAWLVQQLWEVLGVAVPVNYQSLLNYEVENAFEQFDENRDGVISFSEFLKMITSDPWKALLPLEVQDQIVPFVADGRPGGVTLPMAKAPSECSMGKLGGGGAVQAPRAASRLLASSEGYELRGKPCTVRALHGRGHGHTRDLQYAMAESQRINSRLAVSQSQPAPIYRKKRATLPSGFTFMR